MRFFEVLIGKLRAPPCSRVGGFLVAGLVLAVPARAVRAQSASIPAPLRAAIVKKVISYDKTFGNDPVSIVIFANPSASSEASELQGALSRLGLSTSTVVSEDELRRRANEIKVLYVLADDASTGVRNHCRVAHCLSITGSMTFVEQGDVGVGIAAVNGKPQIAVHMRRLGEERQDLSAEMLQLARVIR